MLIFSQYFPRHKVFDGFHAGILKLIMQEQADVIEKWQRYPDEINPYRLLIFDDVAVDLTHAKLIEELAAKGRHYKISVHILTQHPQKLSPIVRSNADVVTVFPLHNHAALNCLHEDYLAMLDEDEAAELLTSYSIKTPKNSQALVIINRETGPLNSRIFTASVPDPGRFIVGCKEYWEGKQTVPSWEELEAMHEERSSNPNSPSAASAAASPLEESDSAPVSVTTKR